MRLMFMFSAILFVVSARAASTVSPCVMAPSDFVSNLEKSDGGARNALWQMIRDCPQKVNDLGNTSVDRLFIRGQLVDWRKDIVTMIKSDFKDRRLDGEEKDFEGLTKILGPSRQDENIRGLLRQSQDDSARKKQCTKKDNRDDSLGPIRNQGEVGWCYAFTAADLISHKLKKRISALDIAYHFNQKDLGTLSAKLKARMNSGNITGKNNFALETTSEGGLTSPAIHYEAEKGACLEADLPSDDTDMSNLKTSLDDLQRLKYQMQKDSGMCQFGNYRQSFARFPALSIPQILQTAYDSDYSDMMVKLADKNCSGKRISMKGIETADVLVSDDKTRADAFATIDKALDHQSIAGIGYYADVLGSDASGSHASSIVGRRYNSKTQQCEYLIRNSWGDEFDESSPMENEDGYYWVPKTNLAPMLSDVTVIK
ncbi:MAG TPA: C1 family peptidase [Bdellovibrio sp.]